MSANVDLSEFEAYGRSRSQKAPCQIRKAADALSRAEARKLLAACERDLVEISTGAITKWLAARGHKVSVPAVTSHRRGTCTCADD